MTAEQPLALKLADALDAEVRRTVSLDIMHNDAARELERLHAENEALREALQGMLNIVNDSRGVAGYHLNGDTAEWDEFDEVDAAEAALARAGEKT